MATIRAHFDGKVIVPDEPVNLPANEPLEITVNAIPENGGTSVSERLAALERVVSRGTHGIDLPRQSLRRVNLYDRA